MRTGFTQRHETYNEGFIYQLIPQARRFVAAGESFSIDAEINYESPASVELRSDMLLTAYAFFVPARLIWANWAQMLNGDTPMLPLTVIAEFSRIFDTQVVAGQSYDAGWRRAYKLLWNEYFSQEVFAPPVNVTTDATVALLSARRVDGRLLRIAADAVDTADNYAVVANTIELNEFARRIDQSRRNLSMALIGDTYLDQLARFGVTVNEALINSPEFLGSSSVVAKPTLVENTVDGPRRGRFEVGIKLSCGRKFFLEHGYLFIMAAARPIDPLHVAPDRLMAANPSPFVNFNDENQRALVEVPANGFGVTAGNGAWVSVNAPYVDDAVYRGALPNGVDTVPNGSMGELMFPNGNGPYSVDTWWKARVQFKGTTHAVRNQFKRT